MTNGKNKASLTPEDETLMIVRKLWRAEKWRRFWAASRYLVYIGIIFGAFYFLTPYVDKATQLISEFQGIKNPQNFQKFLQELQK